MQGETKRSKKQNKVSKSSRIISNMSKNKIPEEKEK